jgi:putative tryptophan/tyrosine transport system substrate-binding protein
MQFAQIRRRDLITLIGRAVAAWPLAARAQQSAMPVVGYFSVRSSESDVPYLAPFRQGLNETGYVEGKNVAIEFRWGGGEYDRLPGLAEDLVRRRVAVIVTSGGPLSALAAKAATTTIPILFVSRDPVQDGLVVSFSHPGGNVTGVVTLLDSPTKQLGLLRDLVPNAAIIAALVNPDDINDITGSWIKDIQAAARAVAQQLLVLTATTEPHIDTAFATLVEKHASALVVGVGAFFNTHREKLIALATRHAVPTIYFRREFAVAGGLMSYGTSAAETYRQLGIYTGRILKGEKPADLPVVQSSKFEFVINLRTAKTLGLTIPPGLIAIADEVIE